MSYIPGWLWFLAAAALYMFYAVNKSNRNRKNNRHEHIKAKQDELIEMLRRKNDDNSPVENDGA